MLFFFSGIEEIAKELTGYQSYRYNNLHFANLEYANGRKRWNILFRIIFMNYPCRDVGCMTSIIVRIYINSLHSLCSI